MDKVVYKSVFPFFPTLGLIFITLKLTGYISWSWWWVTAPIWGGMALGLLFFLIFGAIAVFVLASAFFVLLFDEFMKKK